MKDEKVIYENMLSDRVESERRILLVDILAKAGFSRDIMRASISKLTSDGLLEVFYIEDYGGKNVMKAVLRIKQLYLEFCDCSKGDIVVLDVSNVGMCVLDGLNRVTRDDSVGLSYDPMLVIDRGSIDDISTSLYNELVERCGDVSGIKCIYPTMEKIEKKKRISIDEIRRIKLALRRVGMFYKTAGRL